MIMRSVHLGKPDQPVVRAFYRIHHHSSVVTMAMVTGVTEYTSVNAQLVPDPATDLIQLYVEGRAITRMQGRVIAADGRALPKSIFNGDLHSLSGAFSQYDRSKKDRWNVFHRSFFDPYLLIQQRTNAPLARRYHPSSATYTSQRSTRKHSPVKFRS